MPGRHIFWMIVGQGPIALAVGAGGGFLSSISSLFFFPLSGRRLVGGLVVLGLTAV